MWIPRDLAIHENSIFTQFVEDDKCLVDSTDCTFLRSLSKELSVHNFTSLNNNNSSHGTQEPDDFMSHCFTNLIRDM